MVLGTDAAEMRHDVALSAFQPDSIQMAEISAILWELGLPELEPDVLLSTPIGELTNLLEARTPSPAGFGRPGMVPPLAGRVFHLLPLRREMLEALYGLSTDPAISFRWRYRGAVPSYESFEAGLWQGVLAQFAVVDSREGDLAGHVVAYGVEPAQQHAWIGCVFAPKYVGTGFPIEPVTLFIQYLFVTWNLRKLYMETPEFNYQSLASGAGSLFAVEGRFHVAVQVLGR